MVVVVWRSRALMMIVTDIRGTWRFHLSVQFQRRVLRANSSEWVFEVVKKNLCSIPCECCTNSVAEKVRLMSFSYVNLALEVTVSIGRSVGWLICCFGSRVTEIYQQLLDGLSWNSQSFMVPMCWTVMILVVLCSGSLDPNYGSFNFPDGTIFWSKIEVVQ